MTGSIFCYPKAIHTLLLITLLGCVPGGAENEDEALETVVYLELISQDEPTLREERNIRFCLAADVGAPSPVDPPRKILERVRSEVENAVAISDCDVNWLIHERGPRKDLESLDVMLWIRKVKISGKNASVMILRSGRYGHRERLSFNLVRQETGWTVLSMRQISIE